MNRVSIAIRPIVNRSVSLLLLVVMVVASIFFGIATAWGGGQLKITPHIDVRSEYDSNITYRRNNEIDDYKLVLNPGVLMEYDTGKTMVNFSANMDILRFMNESQLDDEHYDVLLSLQHMATERFGFSLSGSYLADTTLDSELEETGYITGRTNRERYSGSVGMSYRLTELSSMIVGYNLSQTNYEDPGSVDSETQSISLSYSRMLNDGRDTLTLSPYYSINSSSTSDVTTYGLTAGLSHIFSERLTLSFSLGARYTETERDLQRIVLVTTPIPHLELQPFRYKTDNWGGVGDASLEYNGDQWTFGLGYNKGLSYTSQGDAVDTETLRAGVSYRVTERLTSRINGSIYRNMSEEEGRVDSRRYVISPALSYTLTEKASLNFSYNFSFTEDDTQDADNDIVRHQVVLSFRYNFPLEY